ncbi:MAG: ankyrin repeat domain-containing protein [Epsilonproteobacteria bacterium]|nr:ankyrin repeat domain-containing protein [Campylobacterota bacterium]
MVPRTKDEHPYTLAQNRNPHDYENVYTLATEHPTLLSGIIHKEQTFAMLCVKGGYADVLERLINEGRPVDLATPCNLDGPHEPQTTVLHELLHHVFMLRTFKTSYLEAYTEKITGLTRLIIKKDPGLLDVPVKKARTARQKVISLLDLHGLIPGQTAGTSTQPRTTIEQPQESAHPWKPTGPTDEDIRASEEPRDNELIRAAKNGDLEKVKVCLASGLVDVNAGDRFGGTPLFMAYENGHIAIVRTLMAAGAGREDRNFESIFVSAVSKNNTEMVAALAAGGLKIRPSTLDTAYMIALSKRNPELVAIINNLRDINA